MSKSTNAEFSFLEAAQTQKHLTVNDALLRLDQISQLVLESITQHLPITANEGECYFVHNADPNFVDEVGKIGIYANGGYIFFEPKLGWTAYVKDVATQLVFSGVEWNAIGGECGAKIIKFDQELSGAQVATTIMLPEKSPIFGVTARVIEEITGPTITSWSIGVASSDDRYGTGLWLGLNGWSRGLTGTPMTYWSDESLVITPDQGSFTAGKVRIYIHYVELALPPEV